MVSVVGYGNDFKVTGKSGIKHQIDVLTEQVVDGKSYRTAIKCKYIKKKLPRKLL